jgi:hypothetical protein
MPGQMPSRMPGWMLRRPYLAVAWLRWLNLFRRRPWLIAVGAVAAVLLIWEITREQFGSWLEDAWSYWGAVAVGAAFHSMLATGRARARVLAEDSYSWLAPLPIAPSRLSRMVSGLCLQLVALAAVLLVSAASGAVRAATAEKLFLVLAVSYLCGFALGRLSKRGEAQGGVPDSNYAAAKRPRSRWASDPQLTPLSFWSEARARVLLKPKVSARVTLLFLLSVPAGMDGGALARQAFGTAAAALVVLSLGGYTVAALMTAFAAGKWLTPTPLRAGPFARAIGSRVTLIQTVTCAAVLLLLTAIAPPHLIGRLTVEAFAFLLLSSVLIALAARSAVR